MTVAGLSVLPFVSLPNKRTESKRNQNREQPGSNSYEVLSLGMDLGSAREQRGRPPGAQQLTGGCVNIFHFDRRHAFTKHQPLRGTQRNVGVRRWQINQHYYRRAYRGGNVNRASIIRDEHRQPGLQPPPIGVSKVCRV